LVDFLEYMMKKPPEDRTRKELDTLLRFSAIVNSSLRIEEVLSHAIKWAEEFVDAEASTIYELDEGAGELFVRVARGEKKPIEGLRLKVGEGVAGKVVQTGDPMVVQDTSLEHSFSPIFDRLTGFITRSMICVPLVVRGHPVGALQVLNKRNAEFTSNDQELLTIMAQQIAVAMENAKLYGRLQERFELAEKELSRTHQRLIRSERLAAVGNLVQGIAHEIRNPITTIGGFAHRIKRDMCSDNDKLAGYADIILYEAQRLEKVLTDIHEFADLLSAEPTLSDLNTIMNRLKEKFLVISRDRGIQIRASIPEDLPCITMDTEQIEFALSNILENAVESMNEGGILSIEVRVVSGRIVISVADTGCGIDAENLDAVYDPFFSSKTKGAGLGLTMVHQIVINHCGRISIESEKGKGTTVLVELPLFQPGYAESGDFKVEAKPLPDAASCPVLDPLNGEAMP
jgi:signal transduction histidine kinase